MAGEVTKARGKTPFRHLAFERRLMEMETSTDPQDKALVLKIHDILKERELLSSEAKQWQLLLQAYDLVFKN